MEHTEYTIEEMDKALEETKKQIFELLEEKKYFQCRDELLGCNEVDIAEILQEVEDEYGTQKALMLFRTLPKDTSVEVFANLDVDEQVAIINLITDPEIQYIIDELDFDDMIDVLEELPANLVDKILEKTPKAERHLINTFLKYKEYSAGSLMTPDYINLKKEWTVREALDHIKEVGMDSETIYTCYVLDTGRKLIGIMSLRALVIMDDSLIIGDIMREEYISAHVDDDQEELSELFKKYGYLAIPVVDNEGRLVGIVTVDDILDVIEEEATEDMERMGGVIDSDDKDYLDLSVLGHVKARLPWLMLLMFSYFITGGIIQSFEDALSSVICLVTYMPMLMGTGGNSGTQASTLIIRGMATGEVEPSDALSVIWKELRISLIVGACLSLINYLRIAYLEGQPPMVALTVCVSMILIVIVAKIIGALLPMGAKLIKLDPALMSGPMMASITDMISLMTYFSIAKALLHI